MTDWPHFALAFVITNVFFGGVVSAFLLRSRALLALPASVLVLLGLGAAPYGVTLILFYVLLLFPGASPMALFATVCGVFIVIAVLAGHGWRALFQFVRDGLGLRKDRSLWPLGLGMVLVTVVGGVILANKPLVDHDALEYAVQGRIFLLDQAIHYTPHRVDPRTGFYFVGLHGFSFPLFFTWEGVLQAVTGGTGDAWGRSVTIWYSALLIALLWVVLRSKERWLALPGAVAATAPLGFAFLLVVYHMDSYRIFLFSFALALFLRLVHSPSNALLILFAGVCGAQAWVHSLGAILGGVLWAFLLVFLPLPFIHRARMALWAAPIILMAGAIHYPLDVFFGTGWIFKDIMWF